MADNELPPTVARLIATVISSMDHVEILRRLSARPGEPLSMEEVTPGPHLEAATLLRAIHDLEKAGLVTRTAEGLVYRPSLADGKAVDELIVMYNTRPVTLVRAIYARPSPVRAFADAFRLRRDD